MAGTFAPGSQGWIALIFVVLGIAVWLRPRNYAYWAGGVTAALSLLYGYFGQTAMPLLWTRMEAILVGAVIGVASAWSVRGIVVQPHTVGPNPSLGRLRANVGAARRAIAKRTGGAPYRPVTTEDARISDIDAALAAVHAVYAPPTRARECPASARPAS